MSFTAADLDWAADVAVVQRDGDGMLFASGPIGGGPSISMLGFTGVWMGWGPVFHTGDAALSGFFVSPKLTFGAFWLGRNTTLFNALVGASVGVGLGDNDIWAGPLNLIPISFVPSDASLAVGLNPQVVRVGFTF